MTELAAPPLFLGLLVLGAAAGLGTAAQRRMGANLVLAYVILVGLAAGLAHREIWPFSRWLVFAYKDIPHSTLNLRAVGADGAEYEIDARALEPFNPVELYTWLSLDFPKLSRQQQDQSAEYLLRLAEEGRARATRGEPIGRFNRYFGPFSATSHFLFSRKWNTGGISPTPFVRFRIYEDSWDIERRRVDPSEFDHRLLYEFPHSP